jgi:hypothetical protein
MGLDTIKVIYTYSIATLLIAGGILFLFFSRNDPAGGTTAALVPVVTGFIGAAVQFVFNRETQANTAAQVAKATAAANQNAANVLTATGMPNVLSDQGS